MTTLLPSPKGKKAHSFDGFIVLTSGAEGQRPVGEAAPSNPAYNAGRCWSWTATWIEGLPHPKLVLPSYVEKSENDPTSIEFHYTLGHIMRTPAALGPPSPLYFQRPS